MKGIIFNILEDFIVENFGDDKYQQIIKSSQLSTNEPFVGPGTYKDQDLIQIVLTASKELNIPVPDALKAFGRYAFPKLAERYPVFTKDFNHPKPFLLTVESIIHVEVNKLYSHAYTPQFTYTDTSENTLTITYKSKRKLYDLMEGLLNGVGDYFNSPIQQKRKIYTKDEEEVCDFELIFNS